MRDSSYKKRALTVLKAAEKSLKQLRRLETHLLKAVSILRSREGDVIITGLGKSAFIAQKLVATLTSLGERASFIHPVDAMHGDLGALSSGDVLIALSFSGQSQEVVRLVEYAKAHFSIPVISMTGNIHSALAKISDVVMMIEIKNEGSPENIAPMASTTAMLVLGDMLASCLAGDFKKETFATLHPGGSLGLKLKQVEQIMSKGRSIPLVRDTDSLKKAIAEINKKKKGIVGIINKKKQLKGVITDGDIRRFFSRHDSLSNVSALDVMTKFPKVISRDASLFDTIKMMEAFQITNLFVVGKDKRTEGIIHMHDIINASLQ